MKMNHSSIPLAKSFPRSLVLTGALFALVNASHAAVLYSTDFSTSTTTTGFSGIVAGATTNGSIGSNDGTYGTFGSGASASGNGRLLNAGNPTMTLTLTNNTGSAYSIDTLNFDFLARTNGPRDLLVQYTSGGLGPASTTVINLLNLGTLTENVSNWPDYNITLSSVLSDTTLGNGESAVFTFTVSDFTGSGTSGSGLDNIAFQGAVAVPEPSAALLGGLGLLALIRRRR